MSDDTRRVLDLLAQGKITVDQADQLLKAVASPQPSKDGASEAGAAPAVFGNGCRFRERSRRHMLGGQPLSMSARRRLRSKAEL